MVYVLKGELMFWYDGRGEETLRAGSVHLPPPGIKHSVVGWSDDIEMVEITSPAAYDTEEVEIE
jgi:quercetin dioxygenase-like cupin family protein